MLLLGRGLLGGAESFIITAAVSWGLALVDSRNTGKVIAWVGSAMFAAFAIGAPAAPRSMPATALRRSRIVYGARSAWRLCCSLRRFPLSLPVQHARLSFAQSVRHRVGAGFRLGTGQCRFRRCDHVRRVAVR